MRTLILMRHARSDLGSSQLADHRRPLNDRGQHDALSMAQWIAEADLIPQIILASTALRVRETVEALQAAWKDAPAAYFSDDLYLASPETILRSIRSDSLDSPRVMVVAHNPGVETLVYQLAGEPLSITPAAVAAFRIKIDNWQRVSAESPATLIAYGRPEQCGN